MKLSSSNSAPCLSALRQRHFYLLSALLLIFLCMELCLGSQAIKPSTVFSILMSLAREQALQRYIGWTFGSFGGITWNQMRTFAPVLLAGTAFALTRSKNMNALLLGEDYARSLGVEVRRERIYLIACTSLLAGTTTAYCGPIAFLGIAVPHLARLFMRTADHHILCPAVILIGSSLALMADLFSNVPGCGIVLPLNAITALIGAPVVLAVVLRRGRMEAA